MYKDIIGKKFNSTEFYETPSGVYGKITDSGVECSYKLTNAEFEPQAEAVCMDLDGTTLTSEEFWVYIMELLVKEHTGKKDFCFLPEDIPFVSGYSTLEHLRYIIQTYCPNLETSDALAIYHRITEEELAKIMRGEGHTDAFKPTEGLKEFLCELKARKIKIGLCTSGLDYKAIPEITAVFRTLKMGDPLKFYDSIITGGRRKDVGDYGTLGEIAVKPHPWLYTELAHMGLKAFNAKKVIGIEDSSAGVMALRFAGIPVIGLNSGNITASGLDCLCYKKVDTLDQILKIILN